MNLNLAVYVMKRYNADRISAFKAAFAIGERHARTSVQGDPQTKWQVVEM